MAIELLGKSEDRTQLIARILKQMPIIFTGSLVTLQFVFQSDIGFRDFQEQFGSIIAEPLPEDPFQYLLFVIAGDQDLFGSIVKKKWYAPSAASTESSCRGIIGRALVACRYEGGFTGFLNYQAVGSFSEGFLAQRFLQSRDRCRLPLV